MIPDARWRYKVISVVSSHDMTPAFRVAGGPA